MKTVLLIIFCLTLPISPYVCMVLGFPFVIVACLLGKKFGNGTGNESANAEACAFSMKCGMPLYIAIFIVLILA